MPSRSESRHPLHALLPFWSFIFAFKVGGGLLYALTSTLGSRVLPVWAVGLAVGVGGFIQLVLDIPAGAFLDRHGYVRTLRWATVLLLASAVALIGGLTVASFLAYLTLSTFAWLVFTPGVEAYVLARAPHALAGRYVALRNIFLSAGTSVAIIILAPILDASLSSMVLAASVPLIAALLALSVTEHETAVTDLAAHPATRITRRQHSLRSSLRAFRALHPASTLLAIVGVVASTFYAVVWFVVPLAVADGLAHDSALLGLSVFDLSVVVLGIGLGWLADRMEKRRLIFLGLLLFAVAASMIGFHLTPWFALIGFFASMGDEMTNITLWAWLTELVRDHRNDAQVTSIITAATDVGWTVGPIVGGLLYALIGPSWTIAATGGLIFLAWLAGLLALRHPSARALATAKPLAEPAYRNRNRD